MNPRHHNVAGSITEGTAKATARSALGRSRRWLDAAISSNVTEDGEGINQPDPLWVNPILKGNDVQAWGATNGGGMWGDPCVLKDGSNYWMYVGAATATSAGPQDPPVSCYRLTSPNGYDTWTMSQVGEVIDPDDTWHNGASPATPFEDCDTSAVILFGGTYHLFYSGRLTGEEVYHIGHATSANGLTGWTHDSVPVLSPTGGSEFYGEVAAEPAPVEYDGKIYLYFTGIVERPGEYTPNKQSIGLMISSTGAEGSWGAPVEILQANENKFPPTLTTDDPENPDTPGWIGYSTPAAAVSPDGNMHLMYDVAMHSGQPNPNIDKEYNQLLIMHAVSSTPNTADSFVEDADPLFAFTDFEWTDRNASPANGHLIGPWLMFDDNKAKIWFSGNGNEEDRQAMITAGYSGDTCKAISIMYAEMPIEEFLAIPADE